MEDEEKKVTENNGKKPNKKLTVILVTVVVILLLAVGVAVGMLVSGKNMQIINNTTENVVSGEQVETSKINESKPLVYDADVAEIVEPNKNIENLYDIDENNSKNSVSDIDTTVYYTSNGVRIGGRTIERYKQIIMQNPKRMDEFKNRDDEYIKECVDKFYHLKSLGTIEMLTELGLTIQDPEYAPENYVKSPDEYTWTGILYNDYIKAMWFVNDILLIENSQFSEIHGLIEDNGYLYILHNYPKVASYNVDIRNIYYSESHKNAVCEAIITIEEAGIQSSDNINIYLCRGNGDFIIYGLDFGTISE